MKRRTATAATLLMSAAGIFSGVGAAAAAGGTAPAAPTASAAPAAPACTGVRYASTSNTIYLNAAKDYTLSAIAAACPKIPLVQTDTSAKTWQLNADLVLQNGARLSLRGSAHGGDVNTLRLRSRASNAKTEVTAITVNGGTLNATGVTVTSWDDQAGKPDTKADYVTGATKRGRAFVRAVSTKDAAGKIHKSTMNIDKSVFTNLGYYAAESYGVAYKTRYCDRANPAACGSGAAGGNQTNSTFSGNYMGTYYWGTRGQRFVGNKYINNIMYGLNGHDGATGITINRNIASDNGNHGIICSQRCGDIKITENRVEGNGKKPWAGPNPDSDVDPNTKPGQVHGIMVHRGVTGAVISNNVINNHPNGSGIAVFDNSGTLVQRNGIEGAKYGIRVSVGSGSNRFIGNRVSNSGDYGVYSFKGSDKPQYTTSSGRPAANVFSGNTISGAKGSIIKLTESDRFSFTGNTIRATTPIEIRGAGHTFTGNTLPAGQTFKLRGTAGDKTSVTVSPSAGVRIDRDSHSTATLK